jgi:hypothetical protein
VYQHKHDQGKTFAFFDPHPYFEVFLTLDTEIISLCPRMVEAGKQVFQEGTESVEDSRVWTKKEEAKKGSRVLGIESKALE